MRILLAVAFFVAGAAAALADAGGSDAAPCRPDFIVPYADQCEFAYKNLKPGSLPRDLAQAFDTCARSQYADLPCVKAADRNVHVVALSALYRSVSLQAEIALGARQFRVAEALLREKLSVIEIVRGEARPGDGAPATERTAAERELAEAKAGECTERALASAGQQYALGKAHKYGELATLLDKKFQDYSACARLLAAGGDRAYVQYVALVSLEESGRASQAAGKSDAAARAYQTCVDEAGRIARDASTRVKGYLATVGTLCKGRKDGTYAVDQPEPIDAQDAKAFKPLTLPKPQRP